MNTFSQFDASDWNLYLNTSNEFIVYNPSKTYATDFNFYGDVDQETKLLDIKNRSEKRINFCDPTCGFDEAKWLNDDVLILVGSFIDFDYYDEVTETSRIYAMIMIVDLEHRKKNIYFNKLDFTKN
ncbi:hypothetical protein EG240_11985 [Paenimyroides tangerinum]|uniref:Uncharacterized protein n=1 Tax=Paenimyroides tangerinum TaxID=2488728 RepID=A0A3P3W2M9_9FLAO|nr:hypothetical protein [Paenimyroides tangerinum]RRJ89351.1 hypothetical protein EG240_11985 [Paenimyroides tangerinum]